MQPLDANLLWLASTFAFIVNRAAPATAFQAIVGQTQKHHLKQILRHH
jgi:hypothetical protein